MKRRLPTLLALAALLFTACGSPDAAISRVEIAPASPDLEPGTSVRFVAQVGGAPEAADWSVLEPDGGAIDAVGNYTAPDAEGTYTVVARVDALGTEQTTAVRVRHAVRVDVAPTTATIAAGDTLAFVATVTGSGDKGVTWSVSEGPAGGSITQAGVYTAPATPGTYTVVATSTAEPSRSGVAKVTVTAPPEPAPTPTPTPEPTPAPTVSIAVTPQSASIAASATLQLAATVTGSTDTSVTWTVATSGGGTVTSAGLYTAPTTAGTYQVVATSRADTTKQATASITVTAPAPAPTPTVPGPYADVTAYGAKGDGVTDDTAAFQKAAATKQALLIPKPRAHYRLSGKVRVYNSVLGQDRPEIRMYGADGTDAKAMFEVQNYTGTGMTITGLLLDGQYDGVGTGGEYSHLVIVKGSTNVTVEDNVLLRPYGDGVYLGGGSNPNPDRNVVVRNNRIEGPRRCTIAVISVVGAKIEGNTLKKSNTYVANIDVEPNPKVADYIDGVEITNNVIDAPGGKAILLYTWTENPAVNKNVRITGNTLRGRWGVRRNATGSSWENITVSGNTYYGDPNGPASETVSFVDITQDTTTGKYVSNVVVEANTISITPRTGTSHKDYIGSIQGVRFASNQYVGTMTYRASITSSTNVTVTGNAPSNVVTVQ